MKNIKHGKNIFKPRQPKLSKVILNSLEQGFDSVDISCYSHSPITRAIYDLSRNKKLKNKKVHFKYTDGSKSGAIQLGSLSGNQISRDEALNLPLINLGVMSFRHPDMDHLIDMYLIQNIQVTDNLGGFNATEKLAYDVMTETLYDQELNSPFLVNLFHTGLESAVIGIYRAYLDYSASLELGDKHHLNTIFFPREANAAKRQLLW